MAALPILPGLMASDDAPDGDEGAPPPETKSALADFLDTLDDTAIQELVQRSTEYASADDNSDEPAPDDGDDDAPPVDDDAPPTGSDATDDDSNAPPDDDDADPAASGGLDDVQNQVTADVEESAAALKQLQSLAEGDSEFAADIAKIAKQAASLDEKVQKCAKLVEKAAGKDDVQAAAQAGMDAADYVGAIKLLGQAAQMLTQKSVAPEATAEDHPALKMWAQKMSGKRSPSAPNG